MQGVLCGAVGRASAVLAAVGKKCPKIHEYFEKKPIQYSVYFILQ